MNLPFPTVAHRIVGPCSRSPASKIIYIDYYLRGILILAPHPPPIRIREFSKGLAGPGWGPGYSYELSPYNSAGGLCYASELIN